MYCIHLSRLKHIHNIQSLNVQFSKTVMYIFPATNPNTKTHLLQP